MRRLLKIMNYAAQLLAQIDIRKQISEHLASKKSNQQHKKKKRNRLISQRLRFLQVIPTGPFFLQFITEIYTTTSYLSAIYNTANM